MDESIYLKAERFKELLDNDKRVVLLNELEKKMNENEEVMALAYKKDMAAVSYSDALSHYCEDSEEVKTALHNLYLSKKKLESHPVVREYLKQYQIVKKLYDEINEIIFSNFNTNLCPRK